MKIVFYSLILNNHQANGADELWEQTGHQYRFVELANLKAEHRKGDTRNYDICPYLLRAWKSEANWQKAMELARTAECCVFSGVQALPFQKERMKLGLLSFDMSERWLKQGIKNILSPAISKMFWAYWFGDWKNKPLYKLCCSAFAAGDHYRLGMYKDKCYKWGYFTSLPEVDSNYSSGFDTNVEVSPDVSTSNITPLMWCSRYLMLKHPELPILMAHNLKKRRYRFVLDMFGCGEYEEQAIKLAKELGVEDVVKFRGTMPNEQLMREMKYHDIFLLTSDRNEGWGAVANESMANGCVLVASDAIGSVPYLVKNGVNGMVFRSASTKTNFDNPDQKTLDELTEKVAWLLDNKERMKEMQRAAFLTMYNTWSPKRAAQNLLQLIDDLQNDRETLIKEGPCSKA